MRILFDQGTPVPLRRFLTDHGVATAYERGWSCLTNGDLISLAEQEGFDLLITTDRNLRYQQNLQGRSVAILVLTTTSWPRILQATERIVAAITQIEAGGYQELMIP
jgi:predicted nuclease of predicted toxin-antitoxin system